MPGLNVVEEFSVIPASVATLPASSLSALAGQPNVRYISPDGAVQLMPELPLLSLVTGLLNPILNPLLGSLAESVAAHCRQRRRLRLELRCGGRRHR